MNDLLSLTDLFNWTIFRIPDYQRGYSWGTLQLDEFWSDILNLLPDREHYTGMISLKKLDKAYTTNEKWNDEKWLLDNWNYNAYHVVDGQQRLTTFIILINEIVNFYKRINKDKDNSQIFVNSIPLNKIIEDYLVISKPDSDNIIKTYKFGYEVDNPSYEFFKHKILGEPNSGLINETFYTLNLENAKSFFEKKIQEEFENNGLSAIEIIFKKITQKLKFNMYYIDNDFNVFVAFETMNNRGKRLSNLELLKNRLIYLSTVFDDDEDNKNAVRNNINQTWKDVYGYLGKNKNKALNDEDFLQDHWIIYFGYTRSNKITYSSFLLNDYFNQNNISNKYITTTESNDEEYEMDNLDVSETETILEDTVRENKKSKLTLSSISKYIKSMQSLIPYWYIIQNPDDSDLDVNIKFMLQSLNRIQFVYFKPLITVLLSKDNISVDKKVECLKKIERYIFLHFRLVNYQSTYRNSFFWNLAHKFYVNEVSIDEVITELNKIDYLSDNKVADMKVLLNNITRLFKNYKGYYSWAANKYFLYEYELYLMNNQANQKIYPENLFKKDDKDKVSIEHIYPQSDTDEYWIKRFGNYTDTERKYLNGSLGNLLPLSLSINVKLQNYSFDDKKVGKNRNRGYENGSHSEMEVAKIAEWNPIEILNRGLKMLKFMEDRFDFIIPNKAERIRMLGLDFMIDENDENLDVTIPEYQETGSTNTLKNVSFSVDDYKKLSANTNPELLDMYKKLDEYILSIDDSIKKNSTSVYISYTNGKSFVEFHFNKDKLFLSIMTGDYDDPESKVSRIDDSYNWSNMNKIDVFVNDDIEYVKNIIKQSYEKTLK